MRYPTPSKNLNVEGVQIGGPLPMVDGQPQAITTTHKGIKPDTSDGKEWVDETPEQKARREAAMAAVEQAADAKAATTLGVSPAVAARSVDPFDPPITQPQQAPSGVGLTGGIRQMDTLPDQQVANEQAKAALLKQQADERVEKERVLREEEARRTAEARARIERSEQEYIQAGNEASTKEDKGWLHNVLLALAAGAGAYGASLGHTPNYALQIIENADKGEMERKKANLDAKFQKYKAAGASLKDIGPWYEKEVAKISAAQKARLSQLETAMEVGLAKFPKAKLEAEAAIEQQRADVAKYKDTAGEKIGQIKKTHSTRLEGETTSETTPKEGSAGSKVPMNVIDSYIGAKQAERDLNAGADAIANKKGFAEWQQAYKDELGTQIQLKGGFKAFTNFAQVVGAVEANLAARLKTPEARAVNRAMIPLTARTARKLDEVGAMSDMTIDKAEGSLGLASTTAAEMEQVARGLAADSRAKAKAIEKQYPTLIDNPDQQAPASQGEPRVAPGGQTTAQKAYEAKTRKEIAQDKAAKPKPLTDKELSGLSKEESADYVAAKQVKPDSPDYKNAQLAIRKLEAKARGK